MSQLRGLTNEISNSMPTLMFQDLGDLRKTWESLFELFHMDPTGQTRQALLFASHYFVYPWLSMRRHTYKILSVLWVHCLSVSTFLSFQIPWVSLCFEDDFAVLRCWRADVGRFAEQAVWGAECHFVQGQGTGSSHRDHLQMDVRQLAHLFLWYCYFRGKKRPAGLKKYVSQKLSLSSVKLGQPLSICMIEY